MRSLIVFVFGILFALNTVHVALMPAFVSITKKQLTCLVDNAYHEAMAEGKLGRLLVTQVVLNRAKLKEESYCSIVYAHKQFSWTLTKRKSIKPELRKKLEYEVIELLHGIVKIPDGFKEATYFHTTSVNPYWSKKIAYVGTHRNHRFYAG